MDKDKSRAQIVLEALLILGVNLASVWAVLPPDQKLWLRLRWSTAARRVLGVLAAREGRAGMAAELADLGEIDRAALRYNVAYWAGVCRDRLAEMNRP